MPVQLLYTFDSAISHIIQATRTPQLTGIMLFFTWLGSTRAVAGLLLAGCLFTLLLKRQESRRQQLQAVIFLLAATAGSWLCSQWLKEMLHRARPAGGLVFAPGYSFPSGHATVAIAFYGALLFLLWPHLPGRLARYTTMLFAATLVLAIGISRIYLGVHYPSDVLGGYVTGSVWLAICVLGWYKAQNSLRKTSPRFGIGGKILHRHTCREYFQGIYALTSFEHSQGRSNLEVVREILAAGVKIIQYREKEASKRHKYQECLEIRHLTRRAGALFIVNDDVDIALAVQADGVHVGQDDLPVEVVRRLVGPDMIIGLSTHSPQQARSAVECGADYIGVGPIFATSTKKDVCAPVGLEYLKYVVEHINIPFVAIGGIKEHNIARVVQTGACCIAMVTEIVGAPDIQKKIAALKAAMERARSQ